MKKVISCLIAMSLIFSIGVPAVSAVNETTTITYEISEEEREREFQRLVNEAIQQKAADEVRPYGNYDYTYSTEIVETKMKPVSGYPGNQPTGGVRFHQPGSFYWKDSGGPEVSASVTFTIPYKVVDFSVGLGVSAGSNDDVSYAINVTDTTSYWKLYVTKNMEVRHTKIWQTNIRTGEVTLYMEMYPALLHSFDLDIRRVS